MLEKSGDEPVARRIRLYRALASTIPEKSPRFAELMALADELEAIEERCCQLRLTLGDDKPAKPEDPDSN